MAIGQGVTSDLSKRPRHHERELFLPECVAVRSDPLGHNDLRICVAERAEMRGILGASGSAEEIAGFTVGQPHEIPELVAHHIAPGADEVIFSFASPTPPGSVPLVRHSASTEWHSRNPARAGGGAPIPSKRPRTAYAHATASLNRIPECCGLAGGLGGADVRRRQCVA